MPGWRLRADEPPVVVGERSVLQGSNELCENTDCRYLALQPLSDVSCYKGAGMNGVVMSGLVNRMNTPRRLARLTIPVMAAAAVVASTPIATADPVNDAYLAQLRAVGLNWPPEHDAAMIGMAQLICDDLGWGWTPDHIAQDVHANLDPRGISIGDVGSMVGLAHQTYCPNQRCWAPHC